jgi:hypothetical protein
VAPPHSPQADSPPPSGLAQKTPLLNSERIKQRYGSYDLDLLWQSDTLRVSNLYSTTHDSVHTTRTLALVDFENPNTPDPAIASVHEQILAGASLGATFKKAGWQVTKRGHRFGEYKVVGATAADTMISRLMRVNLPTPLAFHAYQLEVSDGKHTFPYASLVELHHPDYLRLTDLQRIYPTSPFSRLFSQSTSHDITQTLPRLLIPAATAGAPPAP